MERVTVRMSRGDRSTPWGFGVTEAPNRDVVILNVVGGSLADRAGLRNDDVIDTLEDLNNLDINAVDRLLVTSRDKIQLVVHRHPSGEARVWRPDVQASGQAERPFKVSLQHTSDARAPAGFNSAAVPFDPRVKHLQYNSPMGLYSNENVTESYVQQTQGVTNGISQMSLQSQQTPAYLNSETLRVLKEQEARSSLGSHPNPNNLPVCFICTRPILGVMARVGGHEIHGDCLKCSTCGNSLRNIGHHFIEGKLYCDIHGQQRKGLAGTRMNENLSVRTTPTYSQPQPIQENIRGVYQPEGLRKETHIHVGTPKTQGPISPSNRGVPTNTIYADRKPQNYESQYKTSTYSQQQTYAPPPQQAYAPPPQQAYAPPPQQAYAPPPQQTPPQTYAPPPQQAPPPPPATATPVDTGSSLGRNTSAKSDYQLIPSDVRAAVSPRMKKKKVEWPPKEIKTVRYWQICNEKKEKEDSKEDRQQQSLVEMIEEDDKNSERRKPSRRDERRRTTVIKQQPATVSQEDTTVIKQQPATVTQEDTTVIKQQPATVSREDTTVTPSQPPVINSTHWTVISGPPKTRTSVEPVQVMEEPVQEQIQATELLVKQDLAPPTTFIIQPHHGVQKSAPVMNFAQFSSRNKPPAVEITVEEEKKPEEPIVPRIDFGKVPETRIAENCLFVKHTVDSSTSPIPVIHLHKEQHNNTVPRIEIQSDTRRPSLLIGINTVPKPFGAPASSQDRIISQATVTLDSPKWKSEGEIVDEMDIFTVYPSPLSDQEEVSRGRDDGRGLNYSDDAKGRSEGRSLQYLEDANRAQYDGDVSEMLDEEEEWMKEELELARREERERGDIEETQRQQTDDWSREAMKLLNDEEQSERDLVIVAALNERLQGLREMEEVDRERAIEVIRRYQMNLEEQQDQLGNLLHSAILYLKNFDSQTELPEEGKELEAELRRTSTTPTTPPPRMDRKPQYEEAVEEPIIDRRPPTPPIRNNQLYTESLSDAMAELESIPYPTVSDRLSNNLRILAEKDIDTGSFTRSTFERNEKRENISSGIRKEGALTTSTGRVPVCEACKQQIRGAFVLATGLAWCPEHFVCANGKCGRRLLECGFVEENGEKYCEQCFESYIAPRCAKCAKPIVSDCLNALQKKWHPTCFTCAHCHKPFGNAAFYLENGLAYCEQDWNSLFTTKCVNCNYAIEAGDRWVEALGSAFHSNCFNCTKCHTNLEGESFFAKNGHPFCKLHA